ILSPVECQADPAGYAGARRLHKTAIHTYAVVCRGRDEHVRLIHAGTQCNLEQRTLLRRPWRADHRTGRPSGEPMAECGTVEPGRLARKISTLQSAGIQRV